MFETLEMAPPDAILGLTEAFKKDPNPAKINLSVGVYKDAKGDTPVFSSVKKAEELILKSEKTKNYLAIDGSSEYSAAVQELLFGADHEVVKSKRSCTAHTPGGTAALRVSGDFIKKMFPKARIWMSQPTWPNHPQIFQAAGVAQESYPYFDAHVNGIAFGEMMDAMNRIPEGDVVLLHGCCHNPTGCDPTLEQWKEIADVVQKRKLLPLLDFAYQGLAEGIEVDRAGLLELARPGVEMLICSSFSKNFGLYNERVGALTAVGKDAEAASRAQSHIKSCIRANYSNPPSHGGSVVTTILNNADLRKEWLGEVDVMRARINKMRTLFVDTLKAKGVKADFSFIARQRGMFSFSGLSKEQVETLKKKHGIYVVGNGRINVAGMTEGNMDQLSTAIAQVLS
jgi:aspartate/tyrosine/aromatic aminotransferase